MKKVFSLFVAVIMACLISTQAFATTVNLSNDEYDSYSGSIDGVSGTVVGEYRLRYGSDFLDRFVLNVTGHKSTSSTTKVVSVGAYEISSNKTRYITVETLKSSDGSTISGLSRTRTSTNWKDKDSNNASWYATKTSVSGKITSYVTYECIYSSSTTYVGYPTLYNVS